MDHFIEKTTDKVNTLPRNMNVLKRVEAHERIIAWYCDAYDIPHFMIDNDMEMALADMILKRSTVTN